MVNSMEEAKVRTFIIDGVEMQTTLTAIEIANLPKRISELEKENFDLREGIMLEKMAIPKDKADIRNFYEIFEVPSYNQLEERWEELKRRVTKWWEISETKSGVKLGLRMVLDEMESLQKKDK